MEITVRVVSRLLGTCIVIDRVPVKSEILINNRKEMKMFLAQENVSWEPPAFCFDSTMQTASVKFRNQNHKKNKKMEKFCVAAVFDSVQAVLCVRQAPLCYQRRHRNCQCRSPPMFFMFWLKTLRTTKGAMNNVKCLTSIKFKTGCQIFRI